MPNRFFDKIVPPILRAGGTVNKYIGDGLMAVFETDTPTASAHAGLEAITGTGQALEHFNTVLSNEGSPPVDIGIGLHLGNVALGEIGAIGQTPRTLIGGTVNTASRFESETKVLGVQALVSLATLKAAQMTAPAGALEAERWIAENE